MFRQRIVLPAIVFIFMSVLLIGAFYIASTHRSLEGSKRPELDIVSLAGYPTKLPIPFLSRHVVILFTPTCPHCKVELGNFSRIVRSDRLVQVFGISLGTISMTDSLVRALEIPFPVLVDADGSVERKLRIDRVPVILYVDEKDEILLSLVGSRSFQEDSLLYARFGRSGAPGAPDVGSQEGMDIRQFPDAPPATFRHTNAPSACFAGGMSARMGPVGPRSSIGVHGPPDGPRQAAGPFIHRSHFKKEERSCVPRS